jgi:hypothetical protein
MNIESYIIIMIIFIIIIFLESERWPHIMALFKENKDLQLSSNSNSRWRQLHVGVEEPHPSCRAGIHIAIKVKTEVSLTH